MKVDCYLIIQGVKPKYGPYRESRREPGSVRITKKRPNTRSDELAVRLTVDIPDTLFIRPTLEARISVPGDSCNGPVINTDIADNVAQVIRDQLGVNVSVSVGEPS